MLFPLCQCPQLLIAFRFPKTNVCVLRASQNKAAIWCEVAAHDALHAFCVVDVTGPLEFWRPEANCGIVACRYQLLPRGTVVDSKHSHDVVFMGLKHRCQLAHVECIEVAVLVGDGE